MIHEYAIEPRLLSTWAANKRDYAEFLREYGLGTPRIASSFPKKKANKLRSYFLQNTPPNEQSQHAMRYTEMVNALVETIVLRDVEPVQDSKWSQHAKAENERIPFGVILSSEPIGTDRNLTPDSMYEPESVWNHQDQQCIQRTPEGFWSALSNLLRLATEQVVVIDPYGWTSKAIQQMQYLLNHIDDNRVSPKIPLISIFYKQDETSPDAGYVKQNTLKGVNIQGFNEKLKVWGLEEVSGSDVFHNRCILTEHGGIWTGHGIGVSGEENHTDEAILLRKEIYQKKWRQFVEENCFKVVSTA